MSGPWRFKGRIYTIGLGGEYATLSAAVAAIGTPVPTDVTGTHNGVLAVTAYNDLWTLSGHTVDFTLLDATRQLFLEINNDGLLMPIDSIPDATHIVTTSGRNTASNLTNQTYKLWELPRYLLQFQSGQHADAASTIQLPEKGIYTLKGSGVHSTSFRHTLGMISGRSIRCPNVGIVEVDSIGFDKAGDSTAISAGNVSATAGQCSVLRLHNVDFRDASPTEAVVAGGYSFNGFFAGVEIYDVSCASVGYLTNLDTDKLIIQEIGRAHV